MVASPAAAQKPAPFYKGKKISFYIGSRKLAAWLYNVAPGNDLVLAAIYPGAIMAPLLGDAEKVKFDPKKF